MRPVPAVAAYGAVRMRTWDLFGGVEPRVSLHAPPDEKHGASGGVA